jgi:hypothetical protein
MPEPTALPYRIRPLGARVAAAVGSGAIVFVVTVLWLAMSDEVRADFTAFQRVTLLLVFGAMLALLYAIFRTSALVAAEGLTVVNGYKVRRLEWTQVVRVTISRHRPWALLDLDDGSTVSVMAIQTSDGVRAREATRRLAAVIAEHSRTPRND